jgi:2-polyprenyl-3-methyl-5-hydroxy-6-metoxy-1,4-benzoquinol methylase
LDGTNDLNRAFYACRQRALVRALGHCRSDLSGLRVLDAGCGTGEFSKHYWTKGFEVSGLDISPDAVAHCNSLDIGVFVVGLVSEAAERFQGPFDIIHCFDVLYHLTEDEEWQSALGAFAALSHPNTLWMLTEFNVRDDTTSAPHITKRSLKKYEAELATHGRRIDLELPLYWFYSAFPRLARRFPSWIVAAERLGPCSKLWMSERVSLWVVTADTKCWHKCSSLPC